MISGLWLNIRSCLGIANPPISPAVLRLDFVLATLPNIRVFGQTRDNAVDLKREFASRRDDDASHIPLRLLGWLLGRVLQQPINHRNTESECFAAARGCRAEHIFPAERRLDGFFLDNRGFGALDLRELLHEGVVEVELCPFGGSIKKLGFCNSRNRGDFFFELFLLFLRSEGEGQCGSEYLDSFLTVFSFFSVCEASAFNARRLCLGVRKTAQRH